MLTGKFIGVKNENTFVVRGSVRLGGFNRAVLRATALGCYFATVNGRRVGDAYLAPGWTSYGKTLEVQEYDVTELLHEGENVVEITINAGWYCGRLTWNNLTDVYGKQAAACADLLVDGAVVLCTDSGWTASESVIRQSGIYDGEVIDLVSPLKTLSAVCVPFDKSVLVPQTCEPVRTTQRLSVCSAYRSPKGALVYDFGQNLAGVVEVRVPQGFSGKITLRFAEILVDGEPYFDNLRSAKATDVLVVKGGEVICAEFTYHGFRYMTAEGIELPAENVTALVRHTDMRRTGVAHTSNKRIQRLFDNAEWSLRGNFVDIPTDCPQRDERIGWTGDINVFCRSAAYVYDVRGILGKWMRTVRDDQLPTGEVPFVVPDCLSDRGTDAMWCDAITMVPWALYEMYGDTDVLADNYAAMKAFVVARERTMADGLIAKGHEFGDWLALDTESFFETPVGRTDVYFITNVLHSESLRIVAESAKLLGYEREAEQYDGKRRALVERIQNEYFTKTGRLAVDTITAHALALHFGIVPEPYRGRVARALNDSVIKHRFCMTTGFIGTPFVLLALADNGYFETARRMLFNSAYPGWLYEVDMGATTVWERWNSLLPNGTPNPNGMNSYNHYAYGCFLEFVYSRIGGIRAAAPGFAEVTIAPMPTKGLPSFGVELDSVRGKIASRYEQSNGKITYTIQVPEGVRATICLVGEQPICVGGGLYTFERVCEDLQCEPFSTESLVSEIVDNPKAHGAFVQAFGSDFERDFYWMRHDRVTLGAMLQADVAVGKMTEQELAERLAQANRLFVEA